ncbi:hypothetical protein Mal4_01580 [Maioricimonas rarisocia]|uniref:Uncharacterized protein n=1 Tax=Maioricimonas rarisocia TaxID=2528026 RepID=A0A517Z076_9PLAN|nr:hypothetical protein [Maioricimonas rarisocia]QDU35876.1 hypothetical protein Mal4_01580 [Maioricimonas rarisocia]
MVRLFSIKRLALAGVLAAAGLASAGTAQACDYGIDCYYKPVITYRFEHVETVRRVTVYDAYGCPQRVRKVFVEKVRVPVKTFVKVCY